MNPTGTAKSLDVCVCTFRRSHVVRTLHSIAAARRPAGWRIRIVVADNDAVPEARERIAAAAAEIDLPVRYLHSPAGNISIARNACLAESEATFLAFIDDDETASAEWLEALVGEAERTDASVVLGPVRAIYDEAAPAWMRDNDTHSTFPVHVGNEIRTGYTCNVLIRREASACRDLYFNLARGQTGGEDTEFFHAVHARGGTIAYAPEAWVEEPVLAERCSFNWLARRRFRSGQTHGHLLRERAGRSGVFAQLCVASAKVAYCGTLAAVTAFHTARRNRNLLRACIHVGAVAGLAGVDELRQYGRRSAEANSGGVVEN